MPAAFQLARSVLDFWFEDGLERGWPSRSLGERWFGGGAAQDALITRQFGPAVESALNGNLTDWEPDLLSRLALILLLDQLSRNVHRGQTRAFAGDGRAQKLVLQSLALSADEALPTVARVFFYMPLMHAESESLQFECVNRFTKLLAVAPPGLQHDLEGNLKFAQQHLDIIERFGRFPHRNAVLGRESTPEEIAFLKDGPRFGQ